MRERNQGGRMKEISREVEEIVSDKTEMDLKTWSRVLEKINDVKDSDLLHRTILFMAKRPRKPQTATTSPVRNNLIKSTSKLTAKNRPQRPDTDLKGKPVEPKTSVSYS